MYTSATHLIETLTGASFLNQQKTLFQKLGMTSTFLQPSEVYLAGQGHRFSTPYYFREGCYHSTQHQETPEAQGAGSVQTTAADFAKFIRAMLNRTGPITDSIYQAVTKPRIMIDPKANLDQFGPNSSDTAYALGWDVKYYRATQIVAHDGFINGYGSRMFFLPELKFGAVIIGNSSGAFDLSSIIQRQLIDEFMQLLRDQRFDNASRRLKRFNAQRERREKNAKRNTERRMNEKDAITIPLGNYYGEYFNSGYHSLIVQKKGGGLFIDGSDRSMPFTMPLEHLSGNKKFRGYLTEDDGTEFIVQVSFCIGDDDEVTAVGIAFEEALGDEYLIWFNRESRSETVSLDIKPFPEAIDYEQKTRN